MEGEGKTAEESGEGLQQIQAGVTAPPAPELDYKVETERLKGEVARLGKEKGQLEQSLRSIKGASRQALDEAREVGRLRRSIEQINQKLGLVMQAQIEGDPDKLSKEAQSLETRYRQEDETLTVREQLNEDWTDIGRTVAEALGLPFETEADATNITALMEKDPQLQGIYSLVQQAYDGKPQLMRGAIRQAQALWRDHYVKRHEESKQPQEKKKPTEGAGLNLDAGKEAGGARLADADFFQRYGRDPAKYNAPADHKRAAEIRARM